MPVASHPYRENLMKKSLLCLCFLLCATFIGINSDTVYAAEKEEEVYVARPSIDGELYVDGKDLYARESGKNVQLRGVSTHGLTWFPDFINENLISQVSKDMGANLIRLAMYSENYCSSKKEKEKSIELVRKGVDAAIKADMYVIVDWHILNDSNPQQHMDEALEFFKMIATEYKDSPNVIFEICNEPNGETVWNDVMVYARTIIPEIRAIMPNVVILVGTPEYDRNLGDPTLRRLGFDNLMYVLHFYSSSHGYNVLSELATVRNWGVPVFISECGITESSGDGDIDFESAISWFNFLNETNTSYAVWSLSNKVESSAFFLPTMKPQNGYTDDDLTESGRWVREVIRGKDPEDIERPADVLVKGTWGYISDYIALSLGERNYIVINRWPYYALGSAGVVILGMLVFGLYRLSKNKKKRSGKRSKKNYFTYRDIYEYGRDSGKKLRGRKSASICLIITIFLFLIYLGWRATASVPAREGWLAITANIILLLVEFLGFLESLVLFANLHGKRDYPLPEIPDDEWPDVDIFIATYNEPPELLRKTINGCTRLKYPDKSKVHVWVCDDNRRAHIRELAEELGVGYFDRPDNEGAKAGNLNCAMARTSSPYVVTMDADMIPRSEFLLKTIPYFVDAELRQKDRPEEEKIHLGLLQTPQCFYTPDIFQHALYSEKKAPNEQDFFYRSIEPAKTSSNSVIYGGSNTVLSRRALDDIGGFYTGSITEDFATGMLIEGAGYVSLGLPEPLASGQTPDTYAEHIKQRTRWGRGVISTARQLKIFRKKELNISQKLSYYSSVIYWYSPIKNLIYLLSPLLFAVFAIPVFYCNWLELLVFWLPMFIFQDVSLRLTSQNSISVKWSGIYENAVMPHMLIPIIKEFFGISTSVFKVTDKSGRKKVKKRDMKAMAPFIVFTLLSVAGIVRLAFIFDLSQTISFLVLLFWIIRNLYYLVMSMFLVDGRDSDVEIVKVKDGEMVRVCDLSDSSDEVYYDGITTLMTEHSITMFLDEADFSPGSSAKVMLMTDTDEIPLTGVITEVDESRRSFAKTYEMEILDFGEYKDDYIAFLYNRIPTLPQSLKRDLGVIPHMWTNIAYRVGRTVKS